MYPSFNISPFLSFNFGFVINSAEYLRIPSSSISYMGKFLCKVGSYERILYFDTRG